MDYAMLPADLRAMAKEVKHPELGFFGPNSLSWRIARENALFMGGPRALLLQLAHPHVAQGVSEHSAFMQDPIGRSLRTFSTVYRMVFGSLDTALQVAVRSRAIHSAVKGTLKHETAEFHAGSRYHANRGDLLFWVHATLIDSAIYVYERTVTKLTQREKAKYYEESKTFAKLFGTQEKNIPATYEDFEAYMQHMIDDVLEVTPAAKQLCTALLSGPSWVFRPLAPGSYLLAGGTLPKRIREQYELPWNIAMQFAYDSSVRSVRLALPLMPPQLRYLPAYQMAVKDKGRKAKRLTHRRAAR